MNHSNSGLGLSTIFHVLACALVMAAPSLVHGQVRQRAKLVASDGEAGDRFGCGINWANTFTRCTAWTDLPVES